MDVALSSHFNERGVRFFILFFGGGEEVGTVFYGVLCMQRES